MAWKAVLVNIRSPVLSTPACKYHPLPLLTCRTYKVYQWPWLL